MTRHTNEPCATTTPSQSGPDRLPPLSPTQWTPEQRQYAEEIIKGPRGALISPFVPLLRSPELMAHAQRLGEYLRYRSALGPHLSEFVILLTARHWSQQVEWAIHAPIAEREGVTRDTIRAIAEGRRPSSLTDEESAVHDLCTELHRHQVVSDPTWHAIVGHLGERGAVDLIGLAGYYGFLAMITNAARTAAPASSVPPLPTLVG